MVHHCFLSAYGPISAYGSLSRSGGQSTELPLLGANKTSVDADQCYYVMVVFKIRIKYLHTVACSLLREEM